MSNKALKIIPRAATYHLQYLLAEDTPAPDDWPRLRLVRPSYRQRAHLEELGLEISQLYTSHLDALPEDIKAMMDQPAESEEDGEGDARQEMSVDTLKLNLKAEAETIRFSRLERGLYLKRAAMLISALQGDWSLASEELVQNGSPAWPPLDPQDMDASLDARVELLGAYMDADDLTGLLEVVDAFIKRGGAGLTEDQAKN